MMTWVLTQSGTKFVSKWTLENQNPVFIGKSNEMSSTGTIFTPVGDQSLAPKKLALLYGAKEQLDNFMETVFGVNGFYSDFSDGVDMYVSG